MPSRTHKEVIPEGRWSRAEWVEEALPALLRGVPLDAARHGWAVVTQLERQLFSSIAADFLGGHLDPVCPACGLATEEGTLERAGALWRVSYRTCGDVFDWTEAELRSRVRRAGDT